MWERAHALTLLVYRLTSRFPGVERYGLTSQLRRAAASVATNIVEGCGKNGDTELARYLTIALGSANEVDYLLLLARDLGYLANQSYESARSLVEEVRRMLASLIDRLRRGDRGRS